MQVRYDYRLRTSATAERLSVAEYDLCRWVWNKCNETSKAIYKASKDKAPEDRQTCGPADLDKMLTGWRKERDWLRQGSSVVQQQTVRDFGKSRAKALKDIKNKIPVKQRAGLPRFKSRKDPDDRPSLNYTKNGFSVRNGKLYLAGGISWRVVWSRELPSAPTSVRVYRTAAGEWHASFVVEIDSQPLPATGAAIGIDWGVKEIATTTSDDHDLPHPEYGKQAQVRLARWQRQQARGQKGSRASARSRKRAAKTYAKVARQRQDYTRKWAKKVVRDHDAVAVENFRPKFLRKSRMARKAADAAISQAKQDLIWMAAKHDRKLVLVDPSNTTTDCSGCGARAKRLLLSERTYACTACGLVLPRDKNSAFVVLQRAGLNPSGAEDVRRGAA